MAGIDTGTGTGTGSGKSSGQRKRRARPNGSSLNASWITAAEDAVSSGPSTADTPQPSSLSSYDLAQPPSIMRSGCSGSG
ncbi:hypothetical protein HYQ44_012073 [Verticillium longisporum]|nr:hypothetical protein HYQ44_012073 [Verticillium longisporum]